MKKILMICLCLTGCMHFSRGYTPNEQTNTYSVAATRKIPLTFSIDLDEDGLCGTLASNKEKLAEKIKKSLEKTGIFSSVQLGYGRTDNYHISFVISRSCSDDGRFTGCSVLWVCTLGLVPVGENDYIDGAATVYLRGREIASYGKTEEMTCLYWLPCIIVYPFANGYFAWDNVEDKIINGLVNDFTKEHVERFADK